MKVVFEPVLLDQFSKLSCQHYFCVHVISTGWEIINSVESVIQLCAIWLMWLFTLFLIFWGWICLSIFIKVLYFCPPIIIIVWIWRCVAKRISFFFWMQISFCLCFSDDWTYYCLCEFSLLSWGAPWRSILQLYLHMFYGASSTCPTILYQSSYHYQTSKWHSWNPLPTTWTRQCPTCKWDKSEPCPMTMDYSIYQYQASKWNCWSLYLVLICLQWYLYQVSNWGRWNQGLIIWWHNSL